MYYILCGKFIPHRYKAEKRKQKGETMVNFGEYIKNIRIKKRMTLREFCRETKYDPSNWSKIERNILQPPKSKEILNSIADTLNIEKDSEEYSTMLELAALSYIPTELIESDVVERLPIFLRTIRGQKPTREELEELIKILREG